MAWYLRKSVKLGPVRFNLSKSGIGTSVGVKGFRVGVRPNGKSYIHAGRYGFYYRQELGGGSRESTPSPQSETPITTQSNTQTQRTDTVEYSTAGSQELIPQSRKELLDKLNQSYKRMRLDYFCGGIGLLLSFFAFQSDPIAGWIVVVTAVLAFIFTARWESKTRTVVLDYSLEDQGEHFQKMIGAFNSLASSSRVWSLINSQKVNGLSEWKRNAGASSLIARTEAQIGEGSPPWVETNVSVPLIKTRGQSLYMMPDGILVYDSKGVGFVEYGDLSIDAETTRFIEQQPPHDSKVVDQTWVHPNKKGGPDRRFKNNAQLAVCLYGELRVRSSSGLDLYLMTSTDEAPRNFDRQFNGVDTARSGSDPALPAASNCQQEFPSNRSSLNENSDVQSLESGVSDSSPIKTTSQSPDNESPLAVANTTSQKLAREVRLYFIEIEYPLKTELRKMRLATETKTILEGEITELILRLGVDGRYVSPAAAKLHQNLFGSLHPKTYSFGLEATKDLMKSLVERSPETYGKPYKKPLTLTLIEGFDTTTGSAYSQKVREVFMKVADYSAVYDGQTSSKIQQVLNEVKSALMS